MTEREILKKLVRIVDSGLGLEGDIRTILNTEAREVLASTTDPETEHPAVRAYHDWCRQKQDEWDLEPYCMADGFLAGWIRALKWASEQPYFEHKSGGTGESVLLDYALATPTQLP